MARTVCLAVLFSAVLAGLAPLAATAQPVPVVPDTLDVGLVPFPFTNTVDLMIANAGDQPLIIIDVAAENWADFVVSPRSGTIAPGDTVGFGVTYYPRDIGPDSTTISVSWWWDGVFDTLQVAAHGEGVVNSPRIHVDKDTVFAIVPTNTVIEDIVTISNVGGDLLSWSATDSEPWIHIFPNQGVKAWGLSDELHVEMSAGTRAPGIYDGVVTITSNDLSSPTVEVAVRMEIAPRSIIAVTSPLQFGVIFLGFPTARLMEIENQGVIDLEVTDIVSADPNLTVDTTTLTIPPGGEENVVVTLTPTFLGVYISSLTIHSNDIANPTAQVTVAAAVSDNPPAIVMSTDTIEVSLPWEGAETVDLEIGNSGDFQLTWTVLDTIPWVSVLPPNGAVTAGASYFIDVNFDATLPAGDYHGDLVFTSNDPLNPSVVVPTLLQVLPTTLIEVSETVIEFNARFVGLDETRTVAISNVGNTTLDFTNVGVADPNFSLGATPTSLEPEESFDLDVTFAPLSDGMFADVLVIENNSSNDDSVLVALLGEGVITLQLAVVPDSLADSLGAAGWGSATLSIANPSGKDQPVRLAAFTEAASPSPPASAIAWTGPARPHQPWEGAGTLAPGVDRNARATTAAPTIPQFFENFEDMDIVEWEITGGTGIKEVTSGGANSVFAYRESASPAGHGNGIYLELPDVQPRGMSFWVKPAQADKFANYVTVRDADGREVIFFFATATGTFYVNASTGGDQSFPYMADTWYHVELRDIDWGAKVFDYYVNGVFVKADISFRNATLIDEFARVELYSFSAGATAMWDDVWIDWGVPPSWLTYSSGETVIDSMGTAEIPLQYSAIGLSAGTYEATVTVRTNNAVDALVLVPVVLEVDAVASDVDDAGTPRATALHQNFPNPFNPSTTIAYDVGASANVSLAIYDVAGARVRTLVARALPSGRYTEVWDGTDDSGHRVASGIYFYELRSGSFTQTRKMVLLK